MSGPRPSRRSLDGGNDAAARLPRQRLPGVLIQSDLPRSDPAKVVEASERSDPAGA